MDAPRPSDKKKVGASGDPPSFFSYRRVPWARLLRWEAMFAASYLLRFVSLEIWRASRQTSAIFEELKFGETPLTTVREILRHLPPLAEDDTVIDLGCGRGRAAFYFHFLTGARVLAIDAVPSFIASARNLAARSGCADRVLFYCDDFREAELEDAEVIYACALCFGPDTRRRLLEKIAEGPPGCHLVSVGWRPRHPLLEEVAHFRARFSWGRAPVSIARLSHDPSLSVDGQLALAPADDVPLE